MLIRHDPDEFEVVSTSHTCPFHEQFPGKTYAGCTCSGSSGLRRRSDEDIARIKAERRRTEEERILAQAEMIKRARIEASDTKGLVERVYKLPVKHVENYSGEHREWIEEYVLPKWLVADIHKDTLAALSDTKGLVDALGKIERAYDDWNPDGSFASSALAKASTIAREALAQHRGK